MTAVTTERSATPIRRAERSISSEVAAVAAGLETGQAWLMALITEQGQLIAALGQQLAAAQAHSARIEAASQAFIAGLRVEIIDLKTVVAESESRSAADASAKVAAVDTKVTALKNAHNAHEHEGVCLAWHSGNAGKVLRKV